MILIVQTRFYTNLCRKIIKICVLSLHSLGVEPSNITIITVSGMLEAAMITRKLLASYGAALVLGLVLRGLTSHSDLVTHVTMTMLTNLQGNQCLINGMLTVKNLGQLLNKIRHQSQYIGTTLLENSNTGKLLV